MASAAEQMAANVSWAALGKATELRQRILFTIGLLIVYRIGTYIPVPGIDANALRDFMDQARRHRRHAEHVHRRRDQPHGHLRARHHALHLGLDHRAAPRRDVGASEAAQEGRRAGPQEDQPVHPLRHGASSPPSRPTASPSASRRGARDRSGLVLPRGHRHHARRRHDVPDVARRTDHRSAASATASRSSSSWASSPSFPMALAAVLRIRAAPARSPPRRRSRRSS
jgi:hypothetical protein